MINRQEINEALSVLFTCVKSNSSFFLGLVKQKNKTKKKRHNSYLEAAGDRNCVLEHEMLS